MRERELKAEEITKMSSEEKRRHGSLGLELGNRRLTSNESGLEVDLRNQIRLLLL